MPNKPALKTIATLLAIVSMLGFLVYSRLSPNGIFADLQNDLKAIVPDEHSPYTDLDGNPIDISDFKGKPLLVNSWATWTPFSAAEIKTLSTLKERYGDRITFLAINRKEDRAVIRAYLSSQDISTTALSFIADPTDHFYTAVGGYAMPETIVYRSNGTIHTHKRGTITESELVLIIESLLRE